MMNNLGGGAGSSVLLKDIKKNKTQTRFKGDLCKAFLDSMWLSLDSLSYEDMLLENIPS